MGQKDTHAEAGCNDITRWPLRLSIERAFPRSIIRLVGMSPGVPLSRLQQNFLADQVGSMLSPAWLLPGLAWLRALI
jgi:hypothetical protein